MKSILNILCILLAALLLHNSDSSGNDTLQVVSALPGNIPSDAIVLFDGTDLSQWMHPDGRKPTWFIKNGELWITSKSEVGNYNQNNLVTREHFGDMQFHLEFRTPVPAKGSGQKRGNSGIKIHGIYEIQVLDSYENYTKPDRSCGAVYGKTAPLVNASRPPGIWQTYDIIFHAARFNSAGAVLQKPTVTIIHNGVLIQDNVEIYEPTGKHKEEPDQSEGPILLQDHVNPVCYRNIWVRRL